MGWGACQNPQVNMYGAQNVADEFQVSQSHRFCHDSNLWRGGLHNATTGKKGEPRTGSICLKTCDKSKACAVALLTAEEINRQKGRSFGHGVKRRGAKADDDTLIVGIDVPQVIATISSTRGKASEKQNCATGSCRPCANPKICRCSLRLEDKCA